MKRGPQPGAKSAATVLAPAKADAGWLGEPPAWVSALAAACAASTQSSIARRLGYSPAVVSQVIKGNYRGDLVRVEAAVRGALMSESVACPVLGDMRRDVCLSHQRRGFDATSALRARLFRTCPSCPNFLGGDQNVER